MEQKLKELSEIELFSGLSSDNLSYVAEYCLERDFRKGEILFYEGDGADCLYVIVEGEVEVWSDYDKKERDLLAVNKDKCIVGEMALIDELPRSATLIASENVRTYYIDRKNYQEILQNCPSIAVILMKSLSLIVRNSNQSYVATLRERNRQIENTYKELIQTQEKLHIEEKLATIGQFSSMILHDIRNPVSVIKSYSQLALKKWNKSIDPNYKKYFNNIIDETKKLNFLASDLLDFSKGEISLKLSIIELSPFIKDILKKQMPALSGKNIRVRLGLTYEGTLLIDADRFERIIINLLNNAKKAVSRGGSIEIRTWSDKNLLNLSIKDDGCGMSKEILDNLYEPFFSKSGEGGTGLGMVIVKNIVEVHDGTINVESGVGEGTNIHMKFPLSR